MFQRILLAIDSGDPASVAASFTLALAKKFEAAVYVVHVNPCLLGDRGPTSDASAKAADIVADALREMHGAGVDAKGLTYRTTPFDVPAAICDLASQCRANAIVVGARRRRFASFLRRSTREGIARRTSLPVLTAPAPLHIDKYDAALADASSLRDLTVRS